jgi:crotonobetaine/carnitine-CoA ligase
LATDGTGSASQISSRDISVRDLIVQRADRSAGRTFLHAVDGSLTFDEFAVEVDAMARALVALGLRPGDRVGLLAANRLATPIAWLAIIAAGGIEVPLNTQHQAAMHEYVLADCTPRILLVAPTFADRLPAQLPPCVEHVVALGDGPLPAQWPVRRLPESASAPLPDLHYADPCAIQYTSGTTGRTKGALSSHRFLINFARPMVEQWRIGAEDVLYNPFPQCHNSGQLLGVMTSLASGSTFVMDERFSLSRFLPRVRETRSTVALTLFGTLTLIESLDPGPADTDHDLRLVYSTPAPAEQVRRVEQRFRFKVRQNYGSTEQGILACQPYENAKAGSTGPPMDHATVVIADEHDELVGPGVQGQILARPNMPYTSFSGYWNQPDAVAAACRNQWFHTGDMGYLDDSGNLYFVDRAQDVIKVRGEFVSAAELETLVSEHDSVQEASVVGVPADFGGQDILLFVVSRPQCTVDVPELIDFCTARMASFMVPRYAEVVDELPRTMNGKVRKADLRKRGVGPRTWDRGPRRVVPT